MLKESRKDILLLALFPWQQLITNLFNYITYNGKHKIGNVKFIWD